MDISGQLVDQLVRGTVVPFVGAGVSRAVTVAGKSVFPSWSELLNEMADELEGLGSTENADNASIIRLLTRQHFWVEAAGHALRGLNKSNFDRILQTKFLIPRPADADWSLPQAVWDLQPSLVVTTNYDHVLHWTNPDSIPLLNHQKEEFAHLGQKSAHRPSTVWHLHGRIEEAASLILAPSQYDAFYRDRQDLRETLHAAIHRLQTLFVDQTLLFIGFGMEDEYVMDRLRTVFHRFGESTRTHYALLVKDEADAVRAKLWKGWNIQVIPYESHGLKLVEKLHELKDAAARIRSNPHEVRPSRPVSYTQWLADHLNTNSAIKLSGLRPKEGVGVSLSHVYVPVVTRGGALDSERPPRGADAGIALESSQEKPEFELLLNLIGEKSLYVSGAAGSGKTTFCQWLTLALCQQNVSSHPLAPPDQFRESFPEPLKEKLPLLVTLREFWKYLPETGGELTRARLEHSLERWIEATQPGGLAWSEVKRHLAVGQTVLIFDGVDEVPRDGAASEPLTGPRSQLLSGLADAVAAWTTLGNRVLVTSRPYGLEPDEQQQLGLPHAPVSELPAELQRLLVRRWFLILKPDGVQGESISRELWDEVERRPEIAQLASNPLLMTALCIVYGEDRKLPKDEFDLYDRIVDRVLCNRYSNGSNDVARNRCRLCVIAHGMHTGAGLGLSEERRQPQAEITDHEIERILEAYQQNQPGSETRKLSAQGARNELLSHSGLLLPKGDHRAGFCHLTIQDFLAAEWLYDQNRAKPVPIFRKYGGTPEWRRALTLLFGAWTSTRFVSKEEAVHLLTRLINGLKNAEIRLGVVLTDCWRVLHGHELVLPPESQSRLIRFCQTAIKSEVPIAERNELALALGRMGDPRLIGDLRSDDSKAWVVVPADDYRVGDAGIQKEWGGTFALKSEVMALKEAFQLSRYPVTNEQFGKFMASDGYQRETLWDPVGWEWRVKHEILEPALWRNGKWNGATQPIVGISWWEADAFCKWAGGRLPTEREWEAAARGPTGNVYPWGKDWKPGLCNASDAGLGVTSPVGMFPSSASLSGAHDMAGNVWEWCDDLYEVDGERRVLRGGSWYDVSRGCRSAVRGRDAPGNRDVNIGFRVVRGVRTS